MSYMIQRVMNTLSMTTDKFMSHLKSEPTDAGVIEEETEERHKKLKKGPMLVWPLLVPLLVQLV